MQVIVTGDAHGSKSATVPLLVYDGDCGFCRYWVRYWQRLTGNRVDYAPWQSVAVQFADIPRERFAASIVLIRPDGARAFGAEAAFRVLQIAGDGAWLALYQALPPFRWLAERAYALTARHRVLAGRVSRLLWGVERIPTSYDFVSASFRRLIGVLYCCAFASLAGQVVGLVGDQGILPADEYFAAARSHFGGNALLELPSLFWFVSGDAWLVGVCIAGAVGGLLLAFGCCEFVLLPPLYLLWLSLFYAGQEFMHFQWDLLLLEAGFLALLLALRAPFAQVLGRLLLFRFMFLSGWVKLASGDPTWWHLTALEYHFETQPLPTPLAWYAHHLPAPVLAAATGATLAIELVMPFLLWLPRRPRQLAGLSFVLLQASILLTGNYNYFNLLTLALCLFAFDDAAFARLRRRHGAIGRETTRVQPAWRRVPLAAASLVVATLAISDVVLQTTGHDPAGPVATLARMLAPWRIVNAYGVFANMTTERDEIVIEESRDGRVWLPCEFRWKPGDPARGLEVNIPHQPRLDWQMWFAALGPVEQSPWFERLLLRLLEGSPAVAALFANVPYRDPPPIWVRATLYQYRYTTPAERTATGATWIRTALGLYYPQVRLSDLGAGSGAGLRPAAPAP